METSGETLLLEQISCVCMCAQVGGGDQWGNITAGADFVKRVTGHIVHGKGFGVLM